MVAVTDGQGHALANAPVQFTVTVSDGLLATSTGGAGAATQTAVSGADGTASVFLQLGSGLSGVNTVQASVATGGQTASVTFTATAAASPSAGAPGSLTLTSGGYSTGAFTIGVKADGTVWGWGNNSLGQLGNGAYTNSATPVQATGLPGIVAASAGEAFVMALDQFGSVWTWGDNSHQQIGAGLYSAIGTPVQMPGLFNVVFVAAGSYHALAVDTSGNVWTWGCNSQQQLGNGGTADSPAPAQVANIGGIIAAAAGLDVSLALRSDRTVWEWGNGYGTTPVQITNQAGNNLTGILGISAAADDSALAVDSAGNVWSWSPGNAASPVAGLASITTVCAGVYGSGMAIDAAGNVWTWPGSGSAPQPVTGLLPATAVSLANGYSLALAANGNIYGWGTTALLGNLSPESTQTAIELPSLTSVTAAASGWQHALAVRSDGTVWAWGANASGQLGNGSAADSTAPVQVPGLAGASAVAGGASHSLAVAANGSLYAWGSNASGQLGNDDTTGATQSSPVLLSASGTFVSVSAGTSHSLAVDSSGNAWAWGANWYGQLGASGLVQYAPAQVVWTAPAPIVSAVSAGDSHSLAVDSSGNVWAWGANYSGQLGNGDTTGAQQYSPVAVSGLTNVIGVSAGMYHSLAVDGAGAVWAWGGNGSGQINGAASGATQYAPVQVPGLSNMVAVAAGQDYSLAIKSDGTVWVWGGNENGQFGNGTTTGSLIPVQIPWLGGAAKVFAGAASALVLESGQTLASWGSNANGQIGVGVDEAQVTNPEAVLGLNLSADATPLAVLSSPANGAVVAVGAAQTIQAFANGGSPGGSAVAKVEFYREGVKIGEADGAPWQMTWTANVGGAIHFSAVTTDGTGAKSQRALSTLNVIADADGDGLPDWWELEFLGTLGNNANAPAPNGDGLSLIANYLQWINPNDYYSGLLPNLQIVSGNNQNGPAGLLLPSPLTVQVTAASSGAPLANAPVTFSVAGGGGQLAASSGSALASTLTATTDVNGMASIYLQPGGNSTTPTPNQVQASVATGGQTVSQTFSLLATPSGTPPAPVGLTVVSDSPSSLQLTWTNPTVPSANAATSILVQRQSADGSWCTIATLGPTATSYEDTGLTTSQIYTYRLVALNASGGSSTPNPPNTPQDQYSSANSSSSSSEYSQSSSTAPNPPSSSAGPTAGLPTIQYVAIDVSSATVQSPVDFVAIDDSNRIAFGCWSQDLKMFQTYLWTNGAASSLHAYPTWVPASSYWAGDNYWFTGININGDITGSVNNGIFARTIVSSGGNINPFWPSWIQGLDSGFSDYQFFEDAAWSYAYGNIGNSGLTVGTISEPVANGLRAQYIINGGDTWFLTGGGAPPDDANDAPHPSCYSPQGTFGGIIGPAVDSAGSPSKNYAVWTAPKGTPPRKLASLFPVGVSDNGSVIGYDTRHPELGMIILSGNGIPPAPVYLNQCLDPPYNKLLDFQPQANSSQAWINDKGDVILSAIVWNSDTGNWVLRQVRWTSAFTNKGNATSMSIVTFPTSNPQLVTNSTATFPTTATPQLFNNQDLFAAFTTNQSGVQAAAILLPLQVSVVNEVKAACNVESDGSCELRSGQMSRRASLRQIPGLTVTLGMAQDIAMLVTWTDVAGNYSYIQVPPFTTDGPLPSIISQSVQILTNVTNIVLGTLPAKGLPDDAPAQILGPKMRMNIRTLQCDFTARDFFSVQVGTGLVQYVSEAIWTGQLSQLFINPNPQNTDRVKFPPQFSENDAVLKNVPSLNQAVYGFPIQDQPATPPNGNAATTILHGPVTVVGGGDPQLSNPAQ